MIVCKNCSLEFEGNFCPECGQKASTKRYSLKIAFKELFKKLFPLEKGFLYTARHLLTRPGAMVRDYLDGKRANFTQPFQFLLFVVAASLLVFSQQQFEQGFQADVQPGQKAEVVQMQKRILDFVFAHFSLFFLSITPFMALGSKLFYRKHEVNYAEHLILNCYLMAGSSLVSMPFSLIVRATGQNPYTPLNTALAMVPYLLYIAWAYNGFFKPKNRFLGALKAMLTYFLAYLVYILAFSLLIGLGVGIYVAMGGKM